MPSICGVGVEPPLPFHELISKLFGCGVSLVGGVAILFIIYGGFLLLTSKGDPSRIRMGKEYVTYAIVGLLLAIFSFVLVEVIGVTIFQLPGFGQ